MAVTVKVAGLKELDRALEDLVRQTNSRTARAALQRGLIKAVEPMADRARNLAPKRQGAALEKSIKVSAKVVNEAGRAAFSKAIRSGVGKAQATLAMRDARRAAKGSAPPVVVYVGPDTKRSRIAHLVEFGSAPHTIKAKAAARVGRAAKDALRFAGAGGEFGYAETVEHPGATPSPFMRPAFEETQDQVLNNLKPVVATELAKAASRARSKVRAKG